MNNYTRCLLVTLVTAHLTGCFLFEQSTEDPLGSVRVEALLVTDTCGPGVNGNGPSMEYEVELHRSGDRLRWLSPWGTVSGTFLSDDDFCIEVGSSWHVRDADPWYEDPGCAMQQLERICGTVTFSEASEQGAQAQVSNLRARHEAFYSPTEGSNCSDLLGISEGAYLTLPCQIAYEINGSATND